MHKFTFYPGSESFHCNEVAIDPLAVVEIYVDEVQAPLAHKPGRPDFTDTVFAVMVDQQPLGICIVQRCVLTCLKREVADNLARLLQELVRLKKKLAKNPPNPHTPQNGTKNGIN